MPKRYRLLDGFASFPADTWPNHPNHSPADNPKLNSLLPKGKLDHITQNTDRQGDHERRKHHLCQ